MALSMIKRKDTSNYFSRKVMLPIIICSKRSFTKKVIINRKKMYDTI